MEKKEWIAAMLSGKVGKVTENSTQIRWYDESTGAFMARDDETKQIREFNINDIYPDRLFVILEED